MNPLGGRRRIVLGVVLGGAIDHLVRRSAVGKQVEAERLEAARLVEDARRDADVIRKEAEVEAKERLISLRTEVENELERAADRGRQGRGAGRHA